MKLLVSEPEDEEPVAEARHEESEDRLAFEADPGLEVGGVGAEVADVVDRGEEAEDELQADGDVDADVRQALERAALVLRGDRVLDDLGVVARVEDDGVADLGVLDAARAQQQVALR